MIRRLVCGIVLALVAGVGVASASVKIENLDGDDLGDAQKFVGNITMRDTVTAVLSTGVTDTTCTPGQFIESIVNGTPSCDAPSSGVCGSDTWVQFNDGGACGAEAGLAWEKNNNTLILTDSTSISSSTQGGIRFGLGGSGWNEYIIATTDQTAANTNGDSLGIYLADGLGSGNGGGLWIEAGRGGTTGDGGGVFINGGAATGSGKGGDVYLIPAFGRGAEGGGDLFLQSGSVTSANGPGGDIFIEPGQGRGPTGGNTIYFEPIAPSNGPATQEQIAVSFESWDPSVASGTTIPMQRYVVIEDMVIDGVAGGSAEVVTDAASLFLERPPHGTNITVTNAADIMFGRENAHKVKVQDSTTSNTAGAALTIEGADGVGNSDGGAINITAGEAGLTLGDGGQINLTTTNGVADDGGILTISTGDGGSGGNRGGYVYFDLGVGTAQAPGGSVIFARGSQTGITSGTSDRSVVTNDILIETLADGTTYDNYAIWNMSDALLRGVAGGGTETWTTAATVHIYGEPKQSTNAVVASPSALIVGPSLGTPQTLSDGQTRAFQAHAQFLPPTINGVAGGGTETVTDAATVYVSGPPSGSNITFTNNPSAVWVDCTVDGDCYNLLISNSQANAGGSVNERAMMSFGFAGSGNADAGRIAVGKLADYTTGTAKDSRMQFYVDQNGTLIESMRLTEVGAGILTNSDNINGLDVEGNAAIGASYSGSGGASAPTNGLIVQGQTGIGTSGTPEILGNLTVGSSSGQAGLYIRGKSTNSAPAQLYLNDETDPDIVSLAWISATTGSPPLGPSLEINIDTGTKAFVFINDEARSSDFAAEDPTFVVGSAAGGNRGGQTLVVDSGATIANQRQSQFLAPTFSGMAGGGAETITNAATVYIDNAPQNGGNITITNAYALWVDAGLTRLDGGLAIDGSTTQNVTSGTYTPTRSSETNLDSNVTMTEAQWMRVGNTVTVSGRFTADPTTTVTSTDFEITLPVASNLGAAEDAAGVAFCGSISGQGAEVTGVAANDTAQIKWVAGDVTSQSWSYTFSYQII